MRTIFNNIVSDKNLEPKPNTEYIYNNTEVFQNTDPYMISVQKGIIVENVEQIDSGAYSFNIKGQPDKRYTCSYGWAFIENTQKNIDLLKGIELQTIILKAQQRIINELYNQLDRLFKEEEYDPNQKYDELT